MADKLTTKDKVRFLMVGDLGDIWGLTNENTLVQLCGPSLFDNPLLGKWPKQNFPGVS